MLGSAHVERMIMQVLWTLTRCFIVSYPKIGLRYFLPTFFLLVDGSKKPMPWYVSSHTTINLTLSVREEILRQAQFWLFDMLGSAHVERMIIKVLWPLS